MDITKILLISGAAYLAYEYLGGGSTTATANGGTSTNTGAGAPSIVSVAGSLQVGQASTLTVTVANIVGTPAFVWNGTALNANLTGTAGVYMVSIPGALVSGTSGALGVAASNGQAATTLQIVAAAGGGSPAPTSTTGNVKGHAYTTKDSFRAALTAALQDVSNNASSLHIDDWNWYVVNAINSGLLVGGVGPDPDQVAAQAGIGRSDSLSAGQWVAAVDGIGALAYPAGLTGLAALASGINRLNRHPLAGRSVRGKVVIH